VIGLRKMLAQEVMTSVLQIAALVMLLEKVLELKVMVGLAATVAKVSRQRQWYDIKDI
jgi:hypothetical protein